MKERPAIDKEKESELELLRGFKGGEHWAIIKLHSYFYAPLLYFAQKIVPRNLAEEVVLDVFLKSRSFANVEFPTLDHLKRYLYKATKNTALNTLDKERRYSAHVLKYINNELSNIELDKEEIEIEALERVYNAAEKLPPECRKIFKMIYIEDLKHEEVAQKLNLSHKTVRSQKARAIMLIKKSLFNAQVIPIYYALTHTLAHVLRSTSALFVTSYFAQYFLYSFR